MPNLLQYIEREFKKDMKTDLQARAHKRVIKDEAEADDVNDEFVSHYDEKTEYSDTEMTKDIKEDADEEQLEDIEVKEVDKKDKKK